MRVRDGNSTLFGERNSTSKAGKNPRTGQELDYKESSGHRPPMNAEEEFRPCFLLTDHNKKKFKAFDKLLSNGVKESFKKHAHMQRSFPIIFRTSKDKYLFYSIPNVNQVTQC